MYSRSVLRAVLGATACGVVVRNSRRRIVFANDSASRLLRIPRGELRGAGPVRGRGTRLLDRTAAVVDWGESPFEKATQTKQPLHDHRFGLRFADDDITWFVGTFIPLVDSNSNVSRVIATFADITPLQEFQARGLRRTRLMPSSRPW